MSNFMYSQPEALVYWKLFINEEFNNDSYYYDSNNDLVLKNWNIKHNFDNWGGSSIAIFHKDNVKIENSNLVIYTEYNNPYSCPPPYSPTNNPGTTPWQHCNYPIYAHRSGYVESKFQCFYGYYEIKARMDFVNGHWPAFWLHAGSCTTYSEIDIFENISSYYTSLFSSPSFSSMIKDVCGPIPPQLDSSYVSSNVHFPRMNSACNINHMLPFIKDMKCSIPGFSFTDWHTYGFEYWPHKFAWYIDGIKVREINNIENINISPPFNFQYFNVILNSSLDPFQAQNISNYNHFKAKYEIDYFRYYTFDSQCSDVMVDCYDFINHNNENKLSYNIGGSCYNLVPTNKQYQFLVKNDVVINKDFHAPLGADVYMNVQQNYCFENHATTYPHCGISLISCNFNFNDYTNLNRKYIQLGGENNCSVLFPPYKYLKLNASEYIELKPGVSISNNSDVEMKIINCQ